MSEKHSAAMRLRWQDPEYRARKLATMRSPEWEAKKQDGVRRFFAGNNSRTIGTERKTTAKAVRSPSMRDLGWAAGFLEGEGSFYSTNGGAYTTAYQNEREPLARLLEMFGGALHQRQPRRRCPNGVWVWRASGGRARGIAMTMFPMMSARRQGQIRQALGV